MSWDSARKLLDSQEIPIPGDVLASLTELGIQVQRVSNDEAWALCPAHEAGVVDKKAKNWSVLIEDNYDYDNGRIVPAGTHGCFSCGYSGSFVALVADILDMPFDSAYMWVRDRGGVLRAKKILARAKEERKPPEKADLRESDLALYILPPTRALTSRLITQESTEHYGILWDSSKDAFILPVRDPDRGTLWGWQEKGKGHFLNVPEGIRKGHTLFGIGQFPRGYPAILVESPLDVARLHTVGIEGGLASYGAGVTDKQMNLILDRTDTLVLGLDSDKAGTQWSEKLHKRWKNRGLTIKYLNYSNTKAKDVGEMTSNEIHWAVDNAIPGVLVRF